MALIMQKFYTFVYIPVNLVNLLTLPAGRQAVNLKQSHKLSKLSP